MQLRAYMTARYLGIAGHLKASPVLVLQLRCGGTDHGITVSFPRLMVEMRHSPFPVVRESIPPVFMFMKPSVLDDPHTGAAEIMAEFVEASD